ncbi:MAG: hypothetical protein WBW79_12260 [Desulfocapsaceae bacterium]
MAEFNPGFDPRYLAAKKAIDDRALNSHVWQTLVKELTKIAVRRPIHILEIGAGIGTMFERVIDQGLLSGRVTYVASDNDPIQVEAAKGYISRWAQRQNHSLSWSAKYKGYLQTGTAEVSLIIQYASIEELAAQTFPQKNFSLLIAHAVLDLIDFELLLPGLFSNLIDDGMAYLTCNFDGETTFLPEFNGDDVIINHYHASMEKRVAGASRTGSRLLTFLQSAGLDILAAGSSDWIIKPQDRGYSADEFLFLNAILGMVERELSTVHARLPGLSAWIDRRRLQVALGELSLRARHTDVLVRYGRQGKGKNLPVACLPSLVI